jgi:hypothetical protein
MAIGVYFSEANFTSEQYRDAVKRLEAAGVGAPEGRLYHVAFGDENNLQVFDVWESQQTFDKFGEKLMPILAEVGYQPPTPMIAPVHNIIVG